MKEPLFGTSNRSLAYTGRSGVLHCDDGAAIFALFAEACVFGVLLMCVRVVFLRNVLGFLLFVTFVLRIISRRRCVFACSNR